MAYDPNDAKDKEIVDGLVATAVEEATTGLKANVERLKGEKLKLQKSIKDGSFDPETLTRLEGELETTKEALVKAQGDLKKSGSEFAKLKKDHDSETSFTRNLLIDNGLTGALAKAKVAPTLMQGAKALLQGKAQVVIDGDKRVVKIGDKDLDAAVTEWSQSDEGKAYVTAAANDGGGANGGRANSGAVKTATRAQFNDMDQAARASFFAEKGALSD